MNTSCIALSSGLGTRLRPLTYFKPKPLIKIAGIPVIERIINRLHSQGITEVFVNIHYKYKQMLKALEDNVVLSYEPKLLGTAGTVKNLVYYMSDPFFVVNGDTLNELDYEKMYEFHQKSSSGATAFWDTEKNCCAGVYLFDKEYIKHFPFEGMIDPVLEEWGFAQYFPNSFWIDIGSHAKLKEARKHYAK